MYLVAYNVNSFVLANNGNIIYFIDKPNGGIWGAFECVIANCECHLSELEDFSMLENRQNIITYIVFQTP